MNLLEREAIRVRAGDATRTMTLPGVLATLARGEVESFPALRPHQRQPWHCFLAQVGALALAAAGETAPPDAERDWAALLRGLTPGHGDDAPWCLAALPSRPALLQPSLPRADSRRSARRCRRRTGSTCWSRPATTTSSPP